MYRLNEIRHFTLIILMLTSACSTITEGRSQEVAIDTTPEGANCVLRSNDNVIGIIPSTPGRIRVDKSKYDIVIECSKEGYIKSKIKNHSDFAITSLGNMVFGQWGFVGSMVDSATGASNKYDAHMLIALDVDKDAHSTIASAAPLPPQAALPLAQPVTVQAAAQIPSPVQQPMLQHVAQSPASPPILDVTHWANEQSLMDSTRRMAQQPTLEVAELPVHQTSDGPAY